MSEPKLPPHDPDPEKDPYQPEHDPHDPDPDVLPRIDPDPVPIEP
jgi:hypothetical protein